MLLLLLSACEYATVCEEVETEVGDDDALGDLGFTLGELLAATEGVRSFPASASDLSVLTTTMGLARGEGAAVFTDATWVVDRTRLESSVNQDFMLRTCDDALTVPMDLSLTTEDGTFDLSGAAVANTEPWSDTGGLGVVTVVHEVDEHERLDVYFDDGGLVRAELARGELVLLLYESAKP